MQSVNLNGRAWSIAESLEQDLNFDISSPLFFNLDYLGIITLSGEKSLDFLQGQITCDVRKLTQNNALPGAICNLNGRINTILHIISLQGISLVVPCDLLDETMASLNKIAPLSRVKLLHDLDHAILGCYCEHSPNIPFPVNGLYDAGNGFYLLSVKRADLDKIQDLRGSLSWHTLRMKKGHVEIYENSKGAFLPHRLNLHNLGYIHFDKGCYRGQEIIARMHYKSTLKHELVFFESEKPMNITEKMMDGTIELGEVVDCTPLLEGGFLISASMLIDSKLKI